MGANDLLILRAPEINERFDALGSRLMSDSALRDLLVADPARVILKSVFPGEPVPAAEVNRGNRLLYSLLTNEQFVEWAKGYQAELVERAQAASDIEDPDQALRAFLATTDRSEIHRDLAEQVARSADPELLASLTWRPEVSAALPTMEVAVDIETFVYAVAAVAVFVVAVAAVVAGARAEAQVGATREDLRRVAEELSTGLIERGNELRSSGTLLDFSKRNVGFTR